MQRLVVKNGLNALFGTVGYEPGPRFPRRHYEGEQMGGVGAFERNGLKTYATLARPATKLIFVTIPNASACFRGLMEVIELTAENGSKEIREDPTCTRLAPSVFVDLTTQEL
jgi:hypothetical protein